MKTLSSFEGIDLSSPIGLSFDIDEQTYHDSPLFGIGVATIDARYYIALEDAKKDRVLLEALKKEEIEKYVYDGKKILVASAKSGIEVKGIVFDLMLAGYLIDSSIATHPDTLLAAFSKTLPAQGEVDLFGEKCNKEEHSALAFYSLSLASNAKKTLDEYGETNLYEEVELPLMKVLADMEIEGFPLDEAKLLEIGENFRQKKAALEQELEELAGYPFNPSSPKQVAALLYDDLGLKGPKSRSTSVDVLEGLIAKHPIVGKILEYRKYAKLVGTYIDGLLPHRKSDGKIHTSFNQALTSTGRLSSSNPNLQNISTRDEESKEIRKAFHYEDGTYKILSLDYSQIELRLLSALSSCKVYQDIFASGRDLHNETARKIFEIEDGEEVPSDLRRKAKAINFAIVYGTTPFGLAEQIGCSPKEASYIISSFYRAYPEILAYSQKTTEIGENLGYVKTLLGRRRNLPELKDANYMRREAAKRMAMNAPVQGSAADLIKVAMIKVDAFLKENHCKSKMVLQIHDELLFKLDPSEESTLVPNIKNIMEHALPLPVKLNVEGSVGDSWYEAKD